MAAADSFEVASDEIERATNLSRLEARGTLRLALKEAGLDAASVTPPQMRVVVEKVRHLEPGFGLNAATGEYVDMVKAGIIDPAKVTRSALQNAASIAALFLTTEAVVADKPEKHASPAGSAPDMGGMDF